MHGGEKLASVSLEFIFFPSGDYRRMDNQPVSQSYARKRSRLSVVIFFFALMFNQIFILCNDVDIFFAYNREHSKISETKISG